MALFPQGGIGAGWNYAWTTAGAGQSRGSGRRNVRRAGYSITTDAATGKVLHAASETQPGRRLKTTLKSGEVRSVVEN